MIGYAFMGAVHAHAWRSAHRFFDLPLTPDLTVLVRPQPEDAVRAAAERFGFAEVETDWRRADRARRCRPGRHLHAGRPARRDRNRRACRPASTCSARSRWRTLSRRPRRWPHAAAAARPARGVLRCVGTRTDVRRRLALAKQLVDAGRLGTIRQVRAQYLQDWLSDENAPMTWRLQAEHAGSGALGDIGAHIIDTAQWLTGQSITGVIGVLETFVKPRGR